MPCGKATGRAGSRLWIWQRGGRMRGGVFRLVLVFLAYATVITILQSTVQTSQKQYDMALAVSHMTAGGRYLYPVLMAWFVGGVILLLRELPGETVALNEEGSARHIEQPTVEPMS